MKLPAYAHIPGQNARWPDGAFSAVQALTPEVTTSINSAENIPWRYGLRLLQNGFYWECHEVLEPVWLNAPPNSRDRAAVQAVIQTANAALKLIMNRPKAAVRLAQMAAGHLEEASDSTSGVAMGLNGHALSAAIHTLEQGQIPCFKGLD